MSIVEQTINKLASLGLQTCPRCRTASKWTLDVLGVEGCRILSSEQSEPNVILPMAMTSCGRCGFTAMHNMNVLGVTGEEESKDETRTG